MRILDNENAEKTPEFVVLDTTGAFCGATVSAFAGSGVALGVTGTEVASFFSAEGLTSVIEKVGFL
ncbi:hypothetical protein [Flavobacterium hydatis]|uniref:Uncharacterized protein n=1 Tax=Flavobacterium hydatis TaxID=991 RepID=A0A085ZVT3_FLAHY|nr:hypothetical protein [Flavobacterium hydatis]KFF08547.1 hypothetical protein IW20_23705 [Flavobacterium hydatis]OXA91047.1 hypothetical protein B0A62_18375 [Flavobacterium hydatis]